MFIPSSPCPAVSRFLVYVCVSISALQIGSQCHFSRYYIYVCVNIQYLFFSDLLHSAKQAPGSSTSLKLTQMCSILHMYHNFFNYSSLCPTIPVCPSKHLFISCLLFPLCVNCLPLLCLKSLPSRW